MINTGKMEEPQTLNMRRIVRVTLPLGDGSARLREPMNQDWIHVTQAIIQRLENQRESLPLDLLRRFTMNAVFEALQDKDEAVDISLGLAQTFKMILEEVFRLPVNKIQVHSSTQKQSRSGPWACVLFVYGLRKLGLYFELKDPYCSVYKDPTEEMAAAPPPVPAKLYPKATVPVGSNTTSKLQTMLEKLEEPLAPRPAPSAVPPMKKSLFKEKFY